MIHKLSYPLPPRVWSAAPNPDGTTTYTGRLWYAEDILPALLAGGWFANESSYAWDSLETARFAFSAMRTLTLLGAYDAQAA